VNHNLPFFLNPYFYRMRKGFVFLFIMLLFLIWLFWPKQTSIGIQPLGYMSPQQVEWINEGLTQAFHHKVTILPAKKLPAHAITRIKSVRYRADTLLGWLAANQPDSITYTLGITSQDISTTKYEKHGIIKHPAHKYSDWGVFGLGYCPGPSCMVSTYRISNVSDSLFKSRIQKIAIHEVGHNLGLPHCSNSTTCVMQDAAESIRTIDKVNASFCVICKLRMKFPG
jgi:archaemetzincin